MYGCTISGNTSVNEGAGVYNRGTAYLSGCKIDGNTNGNLGAGVWNGYKATIVLIDCTISDNTGFIGGGLYNQGTATLTDCTISQNLAEEGGGGGVFNGGTISDNNALRFTAVLTLTGSTVSDNSALMGGGGVFNYGQATLTDCTIAGNFANKGFDTGVLQRRRAR